MSKKRRPFTSVASQKAIEHLDPRTPQHAKDQKKYRRRREELNWMEGFSHTFLHDEKFKFLGSGIVMNADGDELDSEAYNKLMAEESEARKEYEVWEDYLVKKTGKRRTGWRTRSNLVKKKGKVVKSPIKKS